MAFFFFLFFWNVEMHFTSPGYADNRITNQRQMFAHFFLKYLGGLHLKGCLFCVKRREAGQTGTNFKNDDRKKGKGGKRKREEDKKKIMLQKQK